MRIISGNLKGRLIDYIKNSITRPLKDNVRESIFNIIEHSKLIDIKIKNSTVLDLYSGIGSFGIECISRGAREVTFIDRNIKAINVLKNNLNKFSVINKSRIFSDKIENFLTSNSKDKFNIFFLDPPFSDLNFFQNLKIIKCKKIFKRKHIIIIHREKTAEDNLDQIMKIIINKQYGRSKIFFGYFS